MSYREEYLVALGYGLVQSECDRCLDSVAELSMRSASRKLLQRSLVRAIGVLRMT